MAIRASPAPNIANVDASGTGSAVPTDICRRFRWLTSFALKIMLVIGALDVKPTNAGVRIDEFNCRSFSCSNGFWAPPLPMTVIESRLSKVELDP